MNRTCIWRSLALAAVSLAVYAVCYLYIMPIVTKIVHFTVRRGRLGFSYELPDEGMWWFIVLTSLFSMIVAAKIWKWCGVNKCARGVGGLWLLVFLGWAVTAFLAAMTPESDQSVLQIVWRTLLPVAVPITYATILYVDDAW